jgi:hypothetical protein
LLISDFKSKTTLRNPPSSKAFILQSEIFNLKLLCWMFSRTESRSPRPEDVLFRENISFRPASPAVNVCPNSLPFYRMKSLLPAVRRRKHAPSNFSLTSFTYENP